MRGYNRSHRPLTPKRVPVLILPLLAAGCVSAPSGRALLQRGLQLADARDYDQAAPLFRRAARQDSDAPASLQWAAWNNLGVVLARTGQPRAAVSAYDQALAHWSTAAPVRFNRGIAYLALRRPERAAADFRASVKRNPTFAAGWNNLGIAQIRQRRYRPALRSMERALKQRARSAAAWNNLGVAYLLVGRPVAARRAFTRAVRLRPGYGPAKRNLLLLGKRAQRIDEQTSLRLVVAQH